MLHHQSADTIALLAATRAARQNVAQPAMRGRVMVCVGNEGIPEETFSDLLARCEVGEVTEVVLVAVWEPTEFSIGGDQFHRGLTPQVLNCAHRSTGVFLEKVSQDLSRHGILVEPRLVMGHPLPDVRALALLHGAELFPARQERHPCVTCIPAHRVWCQGPCPIGV